jgi:hypothetical protein
MLGFDERDPQLRQVPRWLHVTYRSDVFLGWFGTEEPMVSPDGRPLYVEVATL